MDGEFNDRGMYVPLFAADGGPNGAIPVVGGEPRRMRPLGTAALRPPTGDLPASSPRLYAVGAGSGAAPHVRVFDAVTAQERASFFAFDPSGTGGVRLAAADFTGDGVPDFAVGTGPGATARVRVLDGTTMAELFALDPFDGFTGGVYVAAGDLDGDGRPDLIVTPDEGGGPRVRAFSGNGFGQIVDFFGIEDTSFRGGARPAVGDLNGDGVGDLIVAAGYGGGPRVAAFDGRSLTASIPVKLFGDFFAFEPELRNGVFITAGDLTGDGLAELIAGGGPGGGPRVTAFDGRSLLNDQLELRANFFAGDPANRGGVRVAARDLDGDDRDDLVVGAGTGAGSRVTAYAGRSIAADGTPPAASEFDAFDGFAGGVFVG